MEAYPISFSSVANVHTYVFVNFLVNMNSAAPFHFIRLMNIKYKKVSCYQNYLKYTMHSVRY